MPIISGGSGGGGTTLSGWSVAGSPANVNTNGGGLTIGANGFLEVIDSGIDVDAGGVELFDTSPLTLHGGNIISGGGDVQTNGGDVLPAGGNVGTVAGPNGTVYAALVQADALALPQFNTGATTIGFYAHAGTAQQVVTSGTVTPEQLALALQANGALGGT